MKKAQLKTQRPPYTPTAEDIAEGCKRAQRKWTEEQRVNRIVGCARTSVEVTIVHHVIPR